MKIEIDVPSKNDLQTVLNQSNKVANGTVVENFVYSVEFNVLNNDTEILGVCVIGHPIIEHDDYDYSLYYWAKDNDHITISKFIQAPDNFEMIDEAIEYLQNYKSVIPA